MDGGRVNFVPSMRLTAFYKGGSTRTRLGGDCGCRIKVIEGRFGCQVIVEVREGAEEGRGYNRLRMTTAMGASD